MTFDDLLGYVSNSGIKIEDSRITNGVIYISLYSSPKSDVLYAIKKLVELGVKIWPGKDFLKN